MALNGEKYGAGMQKPNKAASGISNVRPGSSKAASDPSKVPWDHTTHFIHVVLVNEVIQQREKGVEVAHHLPGLNLFTATHT